MPCIYRNPALVAVLFLLFVFAFQSFAGTISVTNENDSGAGSLRDAITTANTNAGSDTIVFGPEVERIQPLTTLPFLTDATGGTTIDGGGTVILDGDGGADVGLTLDSDNNTIRGMTIINFPGSGIAMLDADGNTIQGCWIGTDGVSSNVGNAYGISMGAGENNQIGGPNPEDRNVVSDNEDGGIGYATESATNNIIEGNFVGTDVTGMFSLGNRDTGIHGDSGSNNVIRNNVVSGNERYGIFVGNGNATGNRIEGNIVGLNATGTAALPNTDFGIYVTRPDNHVGGDEPGDGNVVSGNGDSGIVLNGANNCTVKGNIVGLGADGTTPIGNGRSGIVVSGGTLGAEVGGLAPGAGNTTAANLENGIVIAQASYDTVVRGNRIGTAVDGVTPVGAQVNGILLEVSSGPEIGGAVAEAGNVIAYHSEHGITATPGVVEMTIRRNAIHSNGLSGIELKDGANPNAVTPVLTGIEPITGTATAIHIIEIFVDDDDEGRILVDTVQATGAGTFSSPASLLPYIGMNLTATATAPDGSTSEFSAPVMIDIEIPFHTADQDGDNAISLSELLRVIQFFNSAGFGCEVGTEDGYNPNDPDTGCTPHSSDYNPQDWEISLSELLRLIQFFNSGGYYACPGEEPPTEDGFCPGSL